MDQHLTATAQSGWGGELEGERGGPELIGPLEELGMSAILDCNFVVQAYRKHLRMSGGLCLKGSPRRVAANAMRHHRKTNEMTTKDTTQDALHFPMTDTNESATTLAGGPTGAPTTGENHRRNCDDPTRVFAGSVLGYCRVSCADQNLRRQVDALQAAGCDRIFQDQGVSGSKSSRPGLDELLDYARPGDVIVVQALDRLGRNTRHLLTLVDSLHERHVSLRILTLGVDTATPAGQLVMTVMAALAAMEKAILVERVHSGLEAARRRGRVGGRPPSLTEERRSEVLRMKGDGRTVAEIARLMATSERTVRRVLNSNVAVSSDPQ